MANLGRRDTEASVRRRALVADQFAGRGERADIWRCLDLVVDTGRYLNLGYAGRYRPYLLGNPQARLVDRVASAVEASLPRTAGVQLLDVGCGRGGPAQRLADRLGADVTGVDVVPEGLRRARANARRAGPGFGQPDGTVTGRARHGWPRTGRSAFVCGDAVALPFVDGAFAAGTSVDAIVYVPETGAAFRELARVTRPGGAVVVSDLVADAETAAARRRIDAFAEAWDMPTIPTRAEYLEAVRDAGLTVATVADLSPHSIDRFRTWSRLALTVTDRPGRLPERGLERLGLDAATMIEQVRLAHEAIPDLAHLLVRARRPPPPNRRA